MHLINIMKRFNLFLVQRLFSILSKFKKKIIRTKDKLNYNICNCLSVRHSCYNSKKHSSAAEKVLLLKYTNFRNNQMTIKVGLFHSEVRDIHN